ncbi:MAG: TetR/AcrR family transcriptional regulator [Balneolaceae bacterium]|nr:TetR/AcrR family transcriptional regulator [Balneolaceae bacterium]
MSLREEILDATKDLLLEYGFSKLSMRKIAGRVNVTATSIYLYFKNKDDLLLALIEESIENLKKALSDAAGESKGVMQQLRSVSMAYINYALEHPREYEIIFMVRPEEMPTYPKEKFRQIRSGYTLLAEVLEKGKEEQQFETDDSLLAAYAMWSQLHGVVSVIINKRLDAKVSTEEFIGQAVDQIIQGFISKKIPA